MLSQVILVKRNNQVLLSLDIIIIIIRRHGLAVLLRAGLLRHTGHALSLRLSPYNGITCGQSICDVRV